MTVKGISALVYDLEILRAIPERGAPLLPGIEYCKGWGDHAGMGISVLCAYDYLEDRYRVFLGDNLAAFGRLAAERNTLVSFNGIRFDDRVLRAKSVDLPTGRSYDIMAEIFSVRRSYKGYNLDNCAASNFQVFKSGNGAMAPILWQRGHWGEVIDYCQNDVRLTKMLFDRIIETGGITDPTTEGLLPLRVPNVGMLLVP